MGRAPIIGKYIQNSLAWFSAPSEEAELLGLWWWRHLMTVQRSMLCPGAQGMFEQGGLKSGGSQKVVESFCATRSEGTLYVPALYHSSSKHLPRSHLWTLISTPSRSGYMDWMRAVVWSGHQDLAEPNPDLWLYIAHINCNYNANSNVRMQLSKYCTEYTKY